MYPTVATMTTVKHGLMLTIPQHKLLLEVIAEYNPFYYSPEEVAEVEAITATLKNLIAEVSNPNRYDVEQYLKPHTDKSSGFHKC